MDNYPVNRTGCRPYYNTCNMRKPKDCPNTEYVNENKETKTSVFVKGLAMAYVPKQEFGKIFDLSYALQAGTIFSDLCMPFCGKGRCCR